MNDETTVWDRDGIYVVVGPIWECAFELSKDVYHREYA